MHRTLGPTPTGRHSRKLHSTVGSISSGRHSHTVHTTLGSPSSGRHSHNAQHTRIILGRAPQPQHAQHTRASVERAPQTQHAQHTRVNPKRMTESQHAPHIGRTSSGRHKALSARLKRDRAFGTLWGIILAIRAFSRVGQAQALPIGVGWRLLKRQRRAGSVHGTGSALHPRRITSFSWSTGSARPGLSFPQCSLGP